MAQGIVVFCLVSEMFTQFLINFTFFGPIISKLITESSILLEEIFWIFLAPLNNSLILFSIRIRQLNT